jgi:hypothetical protein
MDKALLNLLILLGVLAFGVFFGVDIANNGIEQVNGPIGETAPAQPIAEDTKTDEALQQEHVMDHKDRVNQQLEQQVPDKNQSQNLNRSLLSQIFHKIGGGLNGCADMLIRWIVNSGKFMFT